MGINTRPPIPSVPVDIQVCFEQTVKVPGKKGQPLSRKQVHKLITDLWAENGQMSKCGKRLLIFLDRIRVGGTE